MADSLWVSKLKAEKPVYETYTMKGIYFFFTYNSRASSVLTSF
jgi:hypothetical protein